MSLNQELILTRCREIEESLDRLKEIAKHPREVFLIDRDMQDIASYRLLVAIEAALSLCYHVSAKRLKKVPEEYAECFSILENAAIITPELSKQMQKTARFRNLLIHMYWKIDYDAVYDIIQHDMNDLHTFSAIIAGLL